MMERLVAILESRERSICFNDADRRECRWLLCLLLPQPRLFRRRRRRPCLLLSIPGFPFGFIFLLFHHTQRPRDARDGGISI